MGAATFEEAVNSPQRGSTSSPPSTKPAPAPKAPITITIYSVETRRSIFTYTVYHMKIVRGNKTYNIERTWSDFKEMHDQVQAALPHRTIPSCPERRFWGVMDPDFVRRRWQDLQDCTNEMVLVPEIRELPAFQNFVENK